MVTHSYLKFASAFSPEHLPPLYAVQLSSVALSQAVNSSLADSGDKLLNNPESKAVLYAPFPQKKASQLRRPKLQTGTNRDPA